MKRKEAVTYLKELLSQCNDMALNAVSFDKSENAEATDYSVHIIGSIHENDKQIVLKVAKQHSLAVKDYSNGVIVYEPK